MKSELPSARSPRRLRIVYLLLVFSVLASDTWAKAPSVNYLFPAGGRRGTTVEVTCHGDFDWPLDVRSPGVATRCLKEKGKLSIEIPEDLATDRVWLRFYNSEGTAKPLPFLVGNLAEVSEVEPNNQPEDAQRIAFPTVASQDSESANQLDARPGVIATVNGVLQESGDLDGFLVRLRKGQTLVADVDANHDFGSPIDSILQIADPDGEVYAENHDTIGLDPRLVFTAPESKDYIVRLFAFPSNPNTQIRYHGAKDCVYRLTLTTGTFVTRMFPIVEPEETESSEAGKETTSTEAVSTETPSSETPSTETPSAETESAEKKGAQTESARWKAWKQLDLAGWNLPANRRTGIEPLAGYTGRIPTEFESASFVTQASFLAIANLDDTAGRMRFRVTPGLNLGEDASLVIPCLREGIVEQRGEVDRYTIELKKAQRVRLIVESRGIGFELSPRASVHDAKGKQLKQAANDGPVQDITLDFEAPDDGQFEIRIEDHFGQASPQHYYRLTVVEPQSDYRLSLSAESLSLPFDEEVKLEVQVMRENGAGEPIGDLAISVVGLPPWVECESVTSKTEGDTSKKVTLVLKAEAFSFVGPVRIQATEGNGVVRHARTPASFGACFDELWLTVGP